MRARTSPPVTFLAILASLALVLVGGMGGQPEGSTQYTADFDLLNADLVPNGGNAYFSLTPGTFQRLEGVVDGELIEVEIRAVDQTRTINLVVDGQPLTVVTRVVVEREWVENELVEVSRNFFARDRLTGNIYYFGESVDNYENGQVVNNEGSWRAGQNGALPGLIMPSVFLLGARYFQEQAPGVALDRARHVAMGLTVTTPAGTFDNCVRVRETSPLEPGDVSDKIYAPDVGIIFDDGVELVNFGG